MNCNQSFFYISDPDKSTSDVNRSRDISILLLFIIKKNKWNLAGLHSP